MQYKEVKSGSIHNITVSGSNITDATIINLMPSTMYVVQVAAINDAGDGVYSDNLTVSTNDSTGHPATTIAIELAATTAQTGPYSQPITITSLTPTSELYIAFAVSIT